MRKHEHNDLEMTKIHHRAPITSRPYTCMKPLVVTVHAVLQKELVAQVNFGFMGKWYGKDNFERPWKHHNKIDIIYHEEQNTQRQEHTLWFWWFCVSQKKKTSHTHNIIPSLSLSHHLVPSVPWRWLLVAPGTAPPILLQPDHSPHRQRPREREVARSLPNARAIFSWSFELLFRITISP